MSEHYLSNLLTKEVQKRLSEETDLDSLPVTAIKGIGSKYAQLLSEKGISYLRELAEFEPGQGISNIPQLHLQAWVIAARLIREVLVEKRKLPSKVIFAGMGNAGKTSIIMSVKNQYNPNQFIDVPPTMGAVPETISILGTPLVVWDFGGQKGFREIHLRIPQNFKNLRLLFYIVDISDENRFSKALTYLSDLVKLILQIGSRPRICVFFHKIDLLSIDIRERRMDQWKNELEKLVSQKKVRFEFFSTTIRDRKSILQAFAYSLRSVSPASMAIASVLQDVGLRLQADAIRLYSCLGLEIASWQKEDCIINNELHSDILSNIYAKVNTPLSQFWFIGSEGEDIGLIPIQFVELGFLMVLNSKVPLEARAYDLEAVVEEIEIWLNAYSLYLAPST